MTQDGISLVGDTYAQLSYSGGTTNGNYGPIMLQTINPATGGCRNIAGRHNGDGTVTVFAITSTISANGDTGADPNKLVKVTDRVSDSSLPTGEHLGHFTTIRNAKAGEVFRGVALAPGDRD